MHKATGAAVFLCVLILTAFAFSLWVGASKPKAEGGITQNIR